MLLCLKWLWCYCVGSNCDQCVVGYFGDPRNGGECQGTKALLAFLASVQNILCINIGTFLKCQFSSFEVPINIFLRALLKAGFDR